MTIDRRSFEYDDLLVYLSLSRIYPCVSSPIWLEISMYEIAILIVVIVSQRNRRRCRSPWFEKSIHSFIHSFQRRGHDHDRAVSYRVPRKSLCWLNGRVESVDLRCSRVMSENGKRGSNQVFIGLWKIFLNFILNFFGNFEWNDKRHPFSFLVLLILSLQRVFFFPLGIFFQLTSILLRILYFIFKLSLAHHQHIILSSQLSSVLDFQQGIN